MARTANPARSQHPSRGLEVEVYLSLLRAADALLREVEQTLKPAGLSPTQYNVLRILRGAGPDGWACREIGCRMITRDPDVTRLLDRLEARGLVSRRRERSDRRVVKTRITPEGLRILKELDEPVDALHRRQLQHMGRRRRQLLARLLDEARARSPRGEA
jgi:DNA-binding MarR family transcriptional regulator